MRRAIIPFLFLIYWISFAQHADALSSKSGLSCCSACFDEYHQCARSAYGAGRDCYSDCLSTCTGDDYGCVADCQSYCEGQMNSDLEICADALNRCLRSC